MSRARHDPTPGTQSRCRTVDPNLLRHDRVDFNDRHAARQTTILVRHLLVAHVHELISHCNHTLIVRQWVWADVLPSKLFLALFNAMAKTSFSTALSFWSGAFMATTDFSSQAGTSVFLRRSVRQKHRRSSPFSTGSTSDCEISFSRSSSYTMAQSTSRTTSCIIAEGTGTGHFPRSVAEHLHDSLNGLTTGVGTGTSTDFITGTGTCLNTS